MDNAILHVPHLPEIKTVGEPWARWVDPSDIRDLTRHPLLLHLRSPEADLMACENAPLLQNLGGISLRREEG